MLFEYTPMDWNNIVEGEKNCFLLTNGLGGFCSLSIIGAAARGDQALFMSAKKAPNVRWHLVSNLLEKIVIDGKEYIITSQRMSQEEDLSGYKYLTKFNFEHFPEWTYKIDNVVIKKTIIMVHGENTVAVNYKIVESDNHNIDFIVTPLLRFTPKNTAFSTEQLISMAGNRVTCDDYDMHVITGGRMVNEYGRVFGPMYFSQDERDGRQETGNTIINHSIYFDNVNDKTDISVVLSDVNLTYSTNLFEKLYTDRLNYENEVVNKSEVTSELGKQLALSADAYLVHRESTDGKTIIAGYPFFEDWGRDTMIALGGVTLVTGRYEECKSILRTFAKYVKNGLLPNLFPEGDIEPMYNSVDAPLLFINSVYEYILYSGDTSFLPEIWPNLEEIVTAYRNGTGYHIMMDKDYLISAGDDLEQLTWMDVRVGDHLPTPRHGKPVEINAYWYNALCVMKYFANKMTEVSGMDYSKQALEYSNISECVKTSFVQKFWNEDEKCLRDVLNGTYEETQVRCNQVWTMTLPFTMLDVEQERMVLSKIREELYTTVGLRTLTPKDPAFHDIYIGGMVERDKAYHQGTVWTFPLGGYYRACLKYIKKADEENKKEWTLHVKEGLEKLNGWLEEGCVGQLAEIYDGKEPTVSRGCFAQAWSVGEVLRAVCDYENIN